MKINIYEARCRHATENNILPWFKESVLYMTKSTKLFPLYSWGTHEVWRSRKHLHWFVCDGISLVGHFQSLVFIARLVRVPHEESGKSAIVIIFLIDSKQLTTFASDFSIFAMLYCSSAVIINKIPNFREYKVTKLFPLSSWGTHEAWRSGKYLHRFGCDGRRSLVGHFQSLVL